MSKPGDVNKSGGKQKLQSQSMVDLRESIAAKPWLDPLGPNGFCLQQSVLPCRAEDDEQVSREIKREGMYATGLYIGPQRGIVGRGPGCEG